MSRLPIGESGGLDRSIVSWQDKAVGTEVVPANNTHLVAMAGSEHLLPPVTHDLNIATSYGLKWDIQKCGRDVWQNFFDANQGTLDGIQYRREEFIDEEGKKASRLMIFGEQTYDWRLLTLIGGTTKGIGEETAGGFGEGAKLLALALLRDHGFLKVEFGSQDWRLNLRIGDLDMGRVTKPTQGLFGDVSKSSANFPGNYILLESRDSDKVDELELSRLFFRSSENPDFDCPTLEVRGRYGLYGFKYLTPKSFGGVPRYGRLYVAGQRRHYNTRPRDGNWDTAMGVNLWTSRDISFGDRDRGAVDSHKVLSELVSPMAEAASQDEVMRVIQTMEPSWAHGRSYDLDVKVLSRFIDNYRGKLDFDPKYLAVDDNKLAAAYRRHLANAGYVLCLGDFERIGMRTVSSLIREMTNHKEVERTPEQQRLVEILETAVDHINRLTRAAKTIVRGQVKLYSNVNEKTFFDGQHKDGAIWMAQEVLRHGTFSRALSVFLHEADHIYGGDESSEFSYALTDTLEAMISASIEGGAHDNLAELAEEWYEVQKKERANNPTPKELQIAAPGRFLEPKKDGIQEVGAALTKKRHPIVRFLIRHSSTS